MLLHQQHAQCSTPTWCACCYAGHMQPAHACRVQGPAFVAHTACYQHAPLPASQPAPPPATKGASTNDISGLKIALAAAAPKDVKAILDDARPARLGAQAYTNFISTFGRRGELDKARQVFEYVPLQQRNVWHVSALCSAYANAGDWLNAVKQLKQSAAEATDHPQLAPNTITYSTVIEACARTAHLDVAVDLFQEMVAAGVEPDTVTYAILMTHFSRNGDWDQVNSLLEEMHSKGMAARTPIYAGYIRHLCHSAQWNRALSLYLVMKELGAEVTTTIYMELLQALSGAGKPCMVAQLLQEAHQDGVPDTRRLLDASLAHLQALGHHDKASTLHDLMLRQGWAPSPAYIPCPETDHEPADMPLAYHGDVEGSGGVAVPASSNSGRPSSSGGCSVASSCCSFGDLPPAARDAGRGKLYQHDHMTGSFSGFAGLPADSTSDAPETPSATAVGRFSPDSSFTSMSSSAYSWTGSSFSTAAGPAASMASLRTDSVATAISDRDCLSAIETPVSSPIRPMQASAPRAADSLPALGGGTKGPMPAEAGAGPSDSQGGAVSGGSGMFGPCYAYIPTQGPSGMMYTVAGPYYYDAGGNWFCMSFA